MQTLNFVSGGKCYEILAEVGGLTVFIVSWHYSPNTRILVHIKTTNVQTIIPCYIHPTLVNTLRQHL